MALTGSQLDRIGDAVRDVFTRDALVRELDTRLEKRLDDITLAPNYEEQVYQLFQAADREGWVDRLIDALVDARAGNQAFVALVAKIRAEPPNGTPTEAESGSSLRPRWRWATGFAALAIAVVIVIVAFRKPPPPPFAVLIAVETGGTAGTRVAAIPMTKVASNRSPASFLALLKTLPGERLDVDTASVFRLSDGASITATGGDPLEADNAGVLVVPKELLDRFPDADQAFTYYKSLPRQQGT